MKRLFLLLFVMLPLAVSGKKDELRKGFVSDGSVASGQGDHLALSSRTVKVGKKPVRDFIMAGYDDKYSILYYGEKVRPYWNRKGDSSIEKQFALASDGYKDLIRRCREFDNQLMKDAYAAGGKEYAELCAVAYRQSVAAHKLIETPSGELAWLSKENFSNGSLGTVDVTYPSFPLYLYYTDSPARASRWLQGRSVVGGYWIKMLSDRMTGR